MNRTQRSPRQAKQSPPATKQRIWLATLTLAALVAIVYWPTLNNQFVSDDTMYVTDTAELASAEGLRDIWFKLGVTPQYYPLVHTALWIQYQLWGLQPAGYHAVNMLMHLAVVVLLWRLLVQLKLPGAWLGAAVYAVHPVQVETVAWISEQKNLLSNGFAIAAIMAYLRFSPLEPEVTPHRKWLYYALAFVLYICALLCKTVTITTPAVILVIFWWKRGRITGRDLLPLLPMFLMGGALAMVTVWMEKEVVGAIGSQWDYTLIERTLIASRAVWFYFGKLLWPHPLSFVYPRWQIADTVWWQYLFLIALLISLAVLALLRHRIGRGPLAAALIFVGVLSPALGFFDVYPFLFSFVADHYQYHASAAALAALVAGGVLIYARWGANVPWLGRAMAVTLLLVLVVVAHQHTYAFYDDETLDQASLKAAPASWAAQYRIGVWWFVADDSDRALAHFREASRLFPQHAVLHTYIGAALAKQNRHDEAISEFQTALDSELHPDDRTMTQTHLAGSLAQKGNPNEAIAVYRQLLEDDPTHLDALHNLAILMGETGDTQAAIDLLRDAIQINPGASRSQLALAEMLMNRGEQQAAENVLNQAILVNPQDLDLRTQYVRYLIQSGNLSTAERQIREALRLAPSADLYNFLGVVYGSRGDLDGAIQQFQAALRLDRTHIEATSNLRQAEAARD